MADQTITAEQVSEVSENAPEEKKSFTIDDIKFSDQVFQTLATEILSKLNEIREIDALIARQKTDFSDDKMLEFAKNSDDATLQRTYETYEKQLKRLADIRAQIVSAVSEKLGAEKLSEEDIKAKREARKVKSELINSSKTVLTNLVNQGMLDAKPDEKNLANAFLENVNVPGSRSSSKSEGGTSTPKPRLNGGMVNVGNQNHPNFGQAASHLSKLVGREVPPVELIEAWTNAANVMDWRDCPEIVEFSFEGHDIKVVKLEKKKEKKN